MSRREERVILWRGYLLYSKEIAEHGEKEETRKKARENERDAERGKERERKRERSEKGTMNKKGRESAI